MNILVSAFVSTLTTIILFYVLHRRKSRKEIRTYLDHWREMDAIVSKQYEKIKR